MGIFMKENPTTDKRNSLGCDHRALRELIKPERLQKLLDMRADYKSKYVTLTDKIHAIKSNNRIKNKNLNFEDIANLNKYWFNYRSLDFFLYRLGYTPTIHATYVEGVEEELYRLYRDAVSTTMSYGHYNGYQSTYWYWAGGCELWREAGEPDNWEVKEQEYWKEYLGILLL